MSLSSQNSCSTPQKVEQRCRWGFCILEEQTQDCWSNYHCWKYICVEHSFEYFNGLTFCIPVMYPFKLTLLVLADGVIYQCMTLQLLLWPGKWQTGWNLQPSRRMKWGVGARSSSSVETVPWQAADGDDEEGSCYSPPPCLHHISVNKSDLETHPHHGAWR